MKYLLEWNYLGYYNETFNSNDIGTNLHDEIKDYWETNKPFDNCSAQLVDESGNIIFVL